MDENFSQDNFIYMDEEDAKNFELITVVLEKASTDSGFGIAISGGREGASQRGGDTGILVSDVVAGSPADTLLNLGDILIAINGTNVENVEHGFAVDLLRSMKKTVYLLLKRRRNSVQKNKRESMQNINLTVPSYANYRANDRLNVEQDASDQDSHYGSVENIQTDCGTTDNYKELTLCLSKNKKGFGLYLGNIVFIKDKVDGTSAAESNLKIGDIVSTINDTPIECCRSTDEVLSLIKKSGKKLKLGIIRPNLRWLPSPLAEKTAYYTKAETSKNLRRTASSSDRLTPAKKFETREHLSKNIKTPTTNELDRSVRCQSIGPTEDFPQLQRSQSISPTRPIKKGYSTNRFEANNVKAQQRPTYRERKISKVQDTYDTEQIIPIINDVHRKHYNRPRSSSTSVALRDTRAIKIMNVGEHMGVQLIGGNKSGIFVSAVMENSPADLAGLRIGDQIIIVNDIDFRHVTREEAVIVLLSMKNEPVIMNCINKIPSNKAITYIFLAYERVKYQQGDEFYIRVNFNYLKPNNPRELILRKGELLIIRDTMYGGTIGSWSGVKISLSCEPGESGVVPNKARAEQLALKFKAEEQKNKEMKRRLRPRRQSMLNTRSEYQSQDKLDSTSFNEEMIQIPAYQKVVKKIADFKRPVILIGDASDLYRDYLKTQLPYEFDYAVSKNNDYKKSDKNLSVKLYNIRKIISSGKHCLLDISCEGIEMLHHINIAPIVILIRLVDKKMANEFRTAVVNMVYGRNQDCIDKKESRRINKYGLNFYKKHSTYLNAIVEILDQPVDQVYIELLDIIRARQNDEIFVSADEQIDENIINSFILKETNYSSGISSNSESCTEDEESLYSRNGDDKVFKINKYESSTTSTSQKYNNKNNYDTSENNDDKGRIIDIKYKEDKNNSNLRSNLSSYTTTSSSATTYNKQTNSKNYTDSKEQRKNIELSLNAVLRIPADTQGGLTESSSTKVSVYVPPGSFNPDEHNKEIFIKIFLPKETTNQISNNEESSSTPIIVCGPEGIKFSRPIEIRIPFNEKSNENIESKIKITPDFYSDSSQWKKLSLNYPGSYGNTF
ncbi:hypothetical protein HZS_3877, partial [Henneguya salminicola]